MNTTENNKLIAEFMGWNKGYNYTKKFQFYEAWGEDVNQMTPEEMAFHYDWNWLVEVVEKIENLINEDNFILYDVTIFSDAVLIADQQGNEVISINKSDNGEFTTKIEATYLACVRFIEWYNKTADKN